MTRRQEILLSIESLEDDQLEELYKIGMEHLIKSFVKEMCIKIASDDYLPRGIYHEGIKRQARSKSKTSRK